MFHYIVLQCLVSHVTESEFCSPFYVFHGHFQNIHLRNSNYCFEEFVQNLREKVVVASETFDQRSVPVSSIADRPCLGKRNQKDHKSQSENQHDLKIMIQILFPNVEMKMLKEESGKGTW